MQKKLTLTIDEDVYAGLRQVIGARKISRFVEELVRPHVLKAGLEQEDAESHSPVRSRILTL